MSLNSFADFKVLSPEEYVGLIAQETLDVLGDNATAHFILQDSRIIGAPGNSAGVTGNTIGSTLHQVYFT